MYEQQTVDQYDHIPISYELVVSLLFNKMSQLRSTAVIIWPKINTPNLITNCFSVMLHNCVMDRVLFYS